MGYNFFFFFIGGDKPGVKFPLKVAGMKRESPPKKKLSFLGGGIVDWTKADLSELEYTIPPDIELRMRNSAFFKVSGLSESVADPNPGPF
jgi:hypothetical protein